ncbi:MAG: hypothetical protein ABJE95_21235 [Byssovorax sp.]
MNRSLLAATAPIALALLLAGCGSVSGLDDLFNQDSGGAAATTSGHGGAAGVTTGSIGGASNTTASGGGATSGPSTTSGDTTTSGPSTTAASTTAASTTAAATTAAASSSSGGPTSTVFCNNAECSPGEICCFNLSQQTDHCGQSGTCGDGFVQLDCNGPEDCPGQVCCGDVDFQMNPPYKSISCKQSCNNPQNTIVICSDADPTCPPGKQCTQSMILGQGYKVCK